MIDGWRFSSADQESEDEAFEAYRALYSGGSDALRGEGPFSAEIRGWRLDQAILFDRRLSGVRHARTTRVAMDAFEHFTLTFVVEGRMSGHADRRPFSAGPGEGFLLDMKREMRNETQAARIITVALARPLVEAAAGSTGRLHGRVLPVGPSALLGDFLQSIVRNAETIPAEALSTVVRSLVDLLAVALQNNAAKVDRRRVNLTRREAAQRLIDDRLGDPDLSPEQLVEVLGMSRASLYRLFADQGGIARFIAERRLAAIRLGLEADDGRSLDELAKTYGLRDGQTARRLFLSVYQADPEVFRPTEDDDERASMLTSRRRWSAWMTEL